MADTEEGSLTFPYFLDLPGHVETLLSKYQQEASQYLLTKTGGKTVYILTIKIGTEMTIA